MSMWIFKNYHLRKISFDCMKFSRFICNDKIYSGLLDQKLNFQRWYG